MIIARKLKYYFEYVVEQKTRQHIKLVDFTGLDAKTKVGADGLLYITTYYYNTNVGEHATTLAIKTSKNKTGLIKGIVNSNLVEQKFRARPMLGTPRYLLVNWRDPFYVVYEGVSGINYDEASHVPLRAHYTGMALATLHGTAPHPINTNIYDELSSMLTLHLLKGVAEEGTILGLLRKHSSVLKNASGGAVIHGDFHQSNVMLQVTPEYHIQKLYVIDTEFMDPRNAHFCRFDDIGTFFGSQALAEFKQTYHVKQTLREVEEFIKSYDETLKKDSAGSVSLSRLYPNGLPLDFFVALWALTNMLDRIERKAIQSPEELEIDKEFILYVLNEDPFSQVSSLL